MDNHGRSLFRRTSLITALVAISSLAVLVCFSCDTKKKVDTALDKVSKLLDEYAKLGKNLNESVTAAKKATVNAVSSLTPTAKAKVPALPPTVTGKKNTAKPAKGKEGTFSHDMNGDGAPEQVYAFENEEGDMYEAWEGTDEEGKEDKADGWTDAGICYLALVPATGAALLIIAECGSAEGAWVCNMDDGQCAACNVAGQCTACDENSDAPCEWPAGGEAPDLSVEDPDGGVEPDTTVELTDCEAMCDALVECELVDVQEEPACVKDCDPKEDAQVIACVIEAAEENDACSKIEACLPSE